KPGQPREVALHIRFGLPQPLEKSQPGWLRKCTITQSQEADAPRFLLRNVTKERGVAIDWLHNNWNCELEQRITTPGAVLLCDYDRDGILDMLIVETKGVALYKGLPGGKFKDVTKEVGLADAMNGVAI